jgi:hypothetical protein
MKLKQKEIQDAVKDPQWQAFRKTLKGLSTSVKLRRLRQYAKENQGRRAQVQVQNYINALKRGGQI